jgi:hypothetical protein
MLNFLRPRNEFFQLFVDSSVFLFELITFLNFHQYQVNTYLIAYAVLTGVAFINSVYNQTYRLIPSFLVYMIGTASLAIFYQRNTTTYPSNIHLLLCSMLFSVVHRSIERYSKTNPNQFNENTEHLYPSEPRVEPHSNSPMNYA